MAEPPPSLRDHHRFLMPTLLGRGGMGEVYKVHDSEVGIPVALKTLQDTRPALVYRLKHEFRALAGLVHPNLVQLFELLIEDDLRCFTMEYVEGTDFVSYVRDEIATSKLDRFLDAAIQLLGGLRVVHTAGRLHRDVKPSNLRVTRDGRVVLLDFDLAVAVGQMGHSVLASAAGGTFAYMPPEALWGKPVGTAADLYSAGVVLYEALCGRLPFARPWIGGRPVPPSPLVELEPWVPPWLDALVLGMLDATPERRPSLEDALQRLCEARPTPRQAPRFAHGRDEFLGRDTEMAQLQTAYAQAPPETAVVLCVSGASGIGKTELLRHFAAQLELDPGVLVVRGRCYPQESVPFKALDAVIDGIARFLTQLDDTRATALLPADVAALARVFPVLGRVSASAGPPPPSDADATEVRQRAFEALRQLLSRLAQQRRLVLWIDDLQWGDTDSAALLAYLLRPPDVPPLVLLLSYRSEDAAGISTLAALRDLGRDGRGIDVQYIDIGPLTDPAATQLITRLSPPGLCDDQLTRKIVTEARGAPFAIAEIARYLHSRRGGSELTVSGVDFGGIVGSRLDELPERAQRLIELVAVAGLPLERSILLRASGDGEPGRAVVALLESECLVRTVAAGPSLGVEAYHDRIREGVLGHLPAGRRSTCHRDLAIALEDSGRAPAEQLAEHFHGGGEPRKAADYVLRAADHASDTLAFVHAAELYRKAREWDPRDAAWQCTIRTREGEALSNAAHFEDASQTFLGAVAGAGASEAIELGDARSNNCSPPAVSTTARPCSPRCWMASGCAFRRLRCARHGVP